MYKEVNAGGKNMQGGSGREGWAVQHEVQAEVISTGRQEESIGRDWAEQGRVR